MKYEERNQSIFFENWQLSWTSMISSHIPPVAMPLFKSTHHSHDFNYISHFGTTFLAPAPPLWCLDVMNVMSQFLGNCLKIMDKSNRNIENYWPFIWSIHDSNCWCGNIISNQSKLLKIKTNNCYAKFPKHQEFGA